MIGHLGSRVSALLDGQLPPEEAERAWQHVQGCHACRDLVEREGWVKTRLAGLAYDAATSAPSSLKGSLVDALGASPAALDGFGHAAPSGRRTAGMVAIGGSAVGAAVVGILALGLGAADSPTIDRRPPVTSISHPGSPQPPRTPTPTESVSLMRPRVGR